MIKAFTTTLAAVAFTLALHAEHFTLPAKGTNGETIVALSGLDLTKITNGWGEVKPNKSIDGNTLTIAGNTYESGAGVHATSRIIVRINGGSTRFVCEAGVDDEIQDKPNEGVMEYRVAVRNTEGQEVEKYRKMMKKGDAAEKVEVDVNGWDYLILEVNEGNGNNWSDHFDWANAYFLMPDAQAAKPEIVTDFMPVSAFACATTTYSLPNVRYMHKVRTVQPNATVSVTDLPDGLTWNAQRKLVEGTLEKEGQYFYKLHTTHEGKSQEIEVCLNVDKDLQQPTPFMGWLSWNSIEGNISEEVVRNVADQMKRTGLVDAGYNYLVIDDLWHADKRHEDGRPKEDPAKFPSGMKASADYVHSKGMKFGIYSDAADKTCAGAYGSLGYEAKDAKQYAEWGVDLLKYDYCFAPADATTAQTRYKAMGDALKATGRDILYYMCEWGTREPWKWGETTGASTWRCTLDTRDCWKGRNGGIGVVQSIAGMKDLWPYSGVNRFNDADMMTVGIHGTGLSSNDLCETGPGMTMDEYRTQFALWCMWSSPLTLSMDMTRALSFEDLAILTNAELIAIDQDPMGQQAEFIGETDGILFFAKDLANGDVAISATNMNNEKRTARFDFSTIPALNATTAYNVRNLWTRANEAQATGEKSVSLEPHATAVYRLTTGALPADARDVLQPLAATPVNGTKVAEPMKSVTLNFAQSLKSLQQTRVDVTNHVGQKIGEAHLKIEGQTLNCQLFDLNNKAGISEVGTFHIHFPSAFIVATNDTHNPSLHLQYAIAAPADNSYAVSFDKETAAKTHSRFLTKVILTEEGDESAPQSIDLLTTRKPYLFLETPMFTVHSGKTITPSVVWGAEWMHHYFYIDLDGNQAFDVVDAESPELVSFNHFNGRNKMGQSTSNNPGSGTLKLPAFTAPTAPGIYRMRVKVDWDSIDPAGRSGDKDAILNNNGSITDFLLKVVVPNGIEVLRDVKAVPRYDLSGRRTTGTTGLYIEGGQKYLPARR